MIQRYVNISFVFIGLLVWVILGATIAGVLDWVAPDWNLPIIGVKFTLSDAIGLAAGIATAVILRKNERGNTGALEIGNELKKVTWPTWKETRLSTIVVIITTIIVAAILGFFDAMWSWATGFVYDTSRTFTFFSFVGLAFIVGGTALLFYYASRD